MFTSLHSTAFFFCRSEGVFSSFYSYFSSEPATNKGPTPEEQEASKQAQSCIRDCHLEQLILDSKFLREDSLQELIKVRHVHVFKLVLILYKQS